MMTVRLWGTRGSLAAPGASTARYGGNTACVEVRGDEDTVLVLDAGTGVRPLGESLPPGLRRVDILLTHLHMDHIQGLGFFGPLYNPNVEVHVWGPASITLSLRTRLMRYLSPPLFPVHLRSLPCRLVLHEVPCGEFVVGPFRIDAALVCHPGPTVAYRVATAEATMAYFPDHEVAMGVQDFPLEPAWTSGYATAAGVDLLIHDAQYSPEEYRTRIGWGHCTFEQALAFAALAGVKHFVPFHHDPAHDDDALDDLISAAVKAAAPAFKVTPGTEGAAFELGSPPAS